MSDIPSIESEMAKHLSKMEPRKDQPEMSGLEDFAKKCPVTLQFWMTLTYHCARLQALKMAIQEPAIKNTAREKIAMARKPC